MKKTRILLTFLVTANLVTSLGLEVIPNHNLTTETKVVNASILKDLNMLNETNETNELYKIDRSTNLKSTDIIEPSDLAETTSVALELTEAEFKQLSEARNARLEKEKQKQKATLSRGSQEPVKELVGEFKLSFYTPSADETDDTPNITASGAIATPGVTVAIDPRYWKMGTEFYVEGYGYVKAQDTGSAIKGPNRMDVCVSTKEEAIQNGIQYRKVWVVKRN